MNYSIEEVKTLRNIIQVYLIAGNPWAEEHLQSLYWPGLFYINIHDCLWNSYVITV